MVIPKGEFPMKALVERMNALCDALPFQTSWYLHDLVRGERADRLGDLPVPSASTRKISILMAALKAVHDGKLALDQKVTIDSRYQDNDSGTFQHLTPGFSITFRDALVMMIIVSDNTCTGTVVDLVGLGEIQRFCESVGMTRTIHRFGIPPRLPADHRLEQVTSTTPRDQGLLLDLMLQGAEDPAVAARLGCFCHDRMSSPSRGYMDAGIVYKETQPLFIFTAYTDGVPTALPDGMPGFAAANQVIGRMARLAWDELSR